MDAYAGAELTIDLARPAASLSVMAMDGEQQARARVMLVPEKGSEPPARLGNVPPFLFLGAAQFGQPAILYSLPPGNYRVIVTPAYDPEFEDPQVVAERYARGEKITLEAGETRSIEVDVQ